MELGCVIEQRDRPGERNTLSKADAQLLPVLEWSPTHVTLYDPGSKRHVSGRSVSEVAEYVNGHKELFVSLSRRSSFVRTLRVPDAPKADVAKILGIQLTQLFPVGAGELASDFYLTSDVNSEGRLAVIGAVKSEVLNQLLTELKAVGLSAKNVLPSALGAALLAQSRGFKDCAVVERTDEGLSIDIVSNGELRYSRVTPFPRDAAEVEAEVCRSFTIAKVPCGESVAAGNLAYEGADHCLSESSMDFFSTPAAGRLALHLEPPELTAQRDKRRIQSKAQIAIILWVAALALGVYVYMNKTKNLGSIRAADARWQVTKKKYDDKQSAIATKINSLARVQNGLDIAFKPAQRLSDVALIIANDAPTGVWLTGVTLERGKPLLIRGTGISNEKVNDYWKKLSGENRLRDVKLVFSNTGTIEKTTVQQFSISAHILGNFPLTEMKKTGAAK